MSKFIQFRDAVNKQVNKICKADEVYTVDIDRDTIWETYLEAFPSGTNPMFRERTEHDCSCCKNFVRNVGTIVTFDGKGNIESAWSNIKTGSFYDEVASAMNELVVNAPIKSIYRTTEKQYGAINNTEMLENGSIHQWDHFYATLPRNIVVSKSSTRTIGEILSFADASYRVLSRSLDEITMDAINTVEELISQNSLYRGDEHKSTVKSLKKIKMAHDKIKNPRTRELFLWNTVVEEGANVRFKNTVIGTLLIDLSDGVDLERAVRSFESKVAPANYKRPTALITKGMIKKAQDKITSLGLEDSLYRRHANQDDLTINDVLFADPDTPLLPKNPLETLTATKKSVPNTKNVTEIDINEFISNVLPSADTLELFVENKHKPKLMSIIAPVHKDTPNILQWDNNFSWSYNGDFTDAIKERVKGAGGNVDGEVRASLSWFNYDDLDIHMVEPTGEEIYFGNRSSRCGGKLDIDMNAGGNKSREAVENIFYTTKSKMKKGTYKVVVHNFCKRESVDVGFDLQIEIDGEITNYHYSMAVGNSENVLCLELVVDADKNVSIANVNKKLTGSTSSQTLWGIDTQDFHKVKMVMNSPNHWESGNGKGNKHYFFILDGCKNDENPRGLYNEFLRGDLVEHRKVFEVLASKMKVDYNDQQLSGIGFSSTASDSFIVKVEGEKSRTYKVNV